MVAGKCGIKYSQKPVFKNAKKVKKLISLTRQVAGWDSETIWVLAQKGRALEAVIKKLACCQYIYVIWIERQQHIQEA